MAVSAVNELCPVLETRNDRPDASRSAALPTLVSGEDESMVSVMVLLTIVPLIVVSVGSVPTPLGEVELLLLPQPEASAVIAPRERV